MSNKIGGESVLPWCECRCTQSNTDIYTDPLIKTVLSFSPLSMYYTCVFMLVLLCLHQKRDAFSLSLSLRSHQGSTLSPPILLPIISVSLLHTR